LRIASWIVVACALVCALGMFVPAFEVRVAGHVVSKRATLSLHKAAGDRELVRRLLAGFRASGGRRVGDKLVSIARPHAGSRLRGYLEDASDAMDTLSGVSDEDVRTYGTIFAIVVWGFLALDALMAAFVFVDVVGGRFRRGHLIVAIVLGVLVAAIAIAIRWGCGEAVAAANDELGAQALWLGSAPTVLVVGAIGAVVAAIATLVLHLRAGRDATVAPSEQRVG
jgi:hypothetical protein